MTTTSLYSNKALEKQRVFADLLDRNEAIPLSLLMGILEPRVQPAPDEVCEYCASDARPEYGGNGVLCCVCAEAGHKQ